MENFTKTFKTNEGLITSKHIDLINNTSISQNIDELFIPLSIIKELKKDVYKALNNDLLNNINAPYKPNIKKINRNIKVIEKTTINNIGDLYDDTSNFYELSPYMNITNDEAKDFFYTLLNEKLIKIDESNETALDKKIPIFTSYANTPNDGEYRIRYKDRDIKLLVKTENNIKITYVI